MRKRKKTEYQKLKGEVWKLFSRFIRLRDCLRTTGTTTRGKCISCPFEYPIEKLQAGHFVDGRGNAILFDEECVHAQCVQCNCMKHGNKAEYRKAIIDLHGHGFPEILEARKNEVKKFTITELEGLKEYYKEQIKRMEE